jgi:hypothetical protein
MRGATVADPGAIKRPPLTARPQHVEDPVHRLAVGHPRAPAAERMRVHALGDQRLDPLPHLIGNREDPRHRAVPTALFSAVLHIEHRPTG